jgi:hypothetical protein
MTAYKITVVHEGNDITARLASHDSIDGWSPNPDGTYEDNPSHAPHAKPNKAIGNLYNLTESEVLTCLSQIIDNGHEWGTVDVDPLYAEAERIVSNGEGSFLVPDGWTVLVTSDKSPEAKLAEATLNESEQRKKRERDVKLQQSREDLRRAITHYETLLSVAASTTQDDKDHEHLAHSLAEVRSAKRVLWFDIGNG